MPKGTLNKALLMGRLGKDPEIKYTSNQKAVANFSLATNEAWKGKDGNTQEITDWHNIVLWGRLAELAGEYLSKGSKVYVEGKIRTRTWKDKNDITHYTTEIIGDRIEFLDSKKQPEEPDNMPEDGLPF